MPSSSFDDFVSSVWQRPRHLPLHELDIVHAAMGLVGEAGEVLDLVKKFCFTPARLDAKGIDFDEKVVEEIADVYFYLRRLMVQLGVTQTDLEDILREKLTGRWITKEKLGE